MKTNLNLWSIGIACVLMQTACMKEDSGMSEVDNSNRKIVWSGDIEQVYQTRVNDAGFCNGDEVGIYITDYLGTTASELKEAGNRADNVKHTFNE
ncbi:MAG: hypothetical protein PHV49_05695, partial [Alistipes sp.]|nr:hypothetical protein [Alistipes sp.]